MIPLALLLAGALSASSPIPAPASPTPTALASPMPTSSTQPDLIVRGRLLAVSDGYVVFTTGDAVRLTDNASIAPKLHLGQSIVVQCDIVSHRARSVEASSGTT